MRNFTPFFIVCILTFLAIQSFTRKENAQTQDKIEKTQASQAQEKPGFVHAVYFWLSDDNPEMVAEFINEGLPKLAKVPSIQSVSWGPAAGTPRDVVDNSYDLAWIVNFATAEDQDKYQVDPLHLEFVEKYKSIFDKVQVYDNIVEHYVAQ